jgi:hypothetical protein
VVRLYLVRHGKAAAAFSEAPDPGLYARGVAQVGAMGLAPLGPLRPSPARCDARGRRPSSLETRWRFTARSEPAVGEIPSPMDDPVARGAWLRGLTSIQPSLPA